MKKVFFLTLAMVFALLTCVIVPRVAAVDVWAAPLPDDVKIVAPAPELPKELAAFLAKWRGHFAISNSFLEAIMVVEEIGADMKEARVIYSTGVLKGSRPSKPCYWRLKAKVIPGTLPKIEFVTEAGSKLTFEMNKDLKSLKATYEGGKGTIIRTKMERID
jgi:hypothetical protein